MLTTITFILMLGVLVVAHEFGHFIVAKMCKMKVEEFAVGMGPRVLRLAKRAETEYNIRAFPIGGFVKITGMEADPSAEPVAGEFYSRPLWQRALVVLAGPVMSLLLGYVIFCGMGMTVGVENPDRPLNQVYYVQPKTEAERMGLKAGDTIAKINDVKVTTGNQMMKIIHDSPGQRIKLVVTSQDGDERLLYGTPKPTPVATADQVDGRKVRGLLGFVPKFETQRLGVVGSIVNGTLITGGMLEAIPKAVFSSKVKDNIGGPVAIVKITNSASKQGPTAVLALTASLSVSLGFFNLLPIPVLDGGHLLLFFVEFLRRGKRLSAKLQNAVQTVGLALLLTLFVLVTVNDLSKLFTH
ncbi:MAG: M50 family metallopeptidase [Armatimonadota bacterium]